jgi:hyperosmotically inducible protein
MLAAVATTGCTRRQPAEGQASSGVGATDTTTASRASGSSDTGTSSGTSAGTSSGSSDTSGSSGSSSGTAAKAGVAIDDSVITTKIKSSILTDSAIKGSDISVDTKNGEVTLTGSVKSQAQMDRAQKLAQNIDGVKSVQNKLEVRQ